MFWLYRACRPLINRRNFSSATKRLASQIFKVPEGPKGPPLPPLQTSNKNARSMLHYIYSVQQQFPEAIVMTQVGSFMELYFHQALEYGPLLNLKVAKKQHRSPIPGQENVCMAGFPLSQKEKYEKMLVKDLGKTVVTLMQDSKHVLTGGSEEEKRPVSRVLTPGTLLDESFVDQESNNYLASVISSSNNAFLMWVDVASGQVRYQVIPKEELGNALARIAPIEVLFDKNSTNKQFIAEALAQYVPTALASPFKYPPVELWNTRANHSQRFHFDGLPSEAQRAYVGLLSYIDTCMPGLPIEIQEPKLFEGNKVMRLDPQARAALEISATSTGSTKGSLLSTIRRTRTLSGSRLLQEWLTAPLQDPAEISRRQDKVQFFLEQSRVIISKLQLLLGEMPDGPRTLQKLWLNRNDPRNLVIFARSVFTLQSIGKSLLSLKQLPADWRDPFATMTSGPLETAKLILEAINLNAIESNDDTDLSLDNLTDSAIDSVTENASTSVSKTTGANRTKKGTRKTPSASLPYSFEPATNRDYRPVLNPSVFPQLQEIYDSQAELAAREYKILARLQQMYGPSVDLRWSPSHHFHVYIIFNGKNEPEQHLLLSKSKKYIYFNDPEWTELGNDRLELNNKLKLEEEAILHEFRESILTSHLSPMRKLYSLVDEVDVQMSFAALAMERGLVRPEIVDDPRVFEIEEGRHITVETGLALGGFARSGFVANDCDLSAPQLICMITGPNMGGKSTFIRQSAIIALLAHVGSFVPAKRAKLGVVDRIFCRIGAGDDLYSGRSTFMVEMLETATILNEATPRSLAIIDEVGRGTSGADGLAIAFASIKHLVLRKQCRTLFATHYGQDIWDALSSDTDKNVTDGIRLLQASLHLSKYGDPVFDYKLKPGISTSSCGLLIAEMAGFPKVALDDAKQIVSSQ